MRHRRQHINDFTFAAKRLCMSVNLDASSFHVGPKTQEQIKTGDVAESTSQIKFYSSGRQKQEEKDRKKELRNEETGE